MALQLKVSLYCREYEKHPERWDKFSLKLSDKSDIKIIDKPHIW